MITVDIEKKKQRIFSSKKRDIQKKNNTQASFELTKQIIKIKGFKEAKIIASFISIKSEISMDHLNDFLITNNKIVSLPVMLEEKEHLIFRKFDENTILKQGKFGVFEPNEKSVELLPDFVLTPCLAFDKFGYRLGYGGGYYDKTFAEFSRLGHSYVSVVVAFDDQKEDKIIKNEYDKKIDFILTEKKIYSSK